MATATFEKTLFLAHHGTKGQKWGLRRFQYEDGSLTPAGLKRYGNLSSKKARLEEKTYKSSKDRQKIDKLDKKLNKLSKKDDEKDKKSNEPLSDDDKKDIIAKGDIKKASPKLHEFSTGELNELKNRFNLQNDIRSLADRESAKQNEGKINKLVKTFDTMKNVGNSAANAIESGKKLMKALGLETEPSKPEKNTVMIKKETLPDGSTVTTTKKMTSDEYAVERDKINKKYKKSKKDEDSTGENTKKDEDKDKDKK